MEYKWVVSRNKHIPQIVLEQAYLNKNDKKIIFKMTTKAVHSIRNYTQPSTYIILEDDTCFQSRHDVQEQATRYSVQSLCCCTIITI